MAIALSLFLFFAVGGLTLLFGYRRYVLAGRVYESLERVETHHSATAQDAPENVISRAATAMGEAFPASAQTVGKLQMKLLSAGYRDRSAVTVLYGLKLMAMASITVVMIFFEYRAHATVAMALLGVLIGLIAGFRLPDFFLAKRITKRMKKLRKGLPDAIDLMIVCAEAGLTTDRAIRNVTQQLGIVHPELCDELMLVTVEIGAGLRRREALENLALRTQENEIRKFVGVIAQADRFGTSMGEALRTHADYMRVRRRQDAEEMASKVGVKMIFPIFLFIMPCMLLVTVGPAAFVIANKMMPALAGTL